MGVKFDYSALKRYRDNLAKLSAEQTRKFAEDAVKELAARLLAKVKRRTPVGVKPEGIGETEKAVGKSGKTKTFLSARAASLQGLYSGYDGGTLRNNWTIGAVKKSGGQYAIEVINPIEYASYVEYGHRGVFVPALRKVMHTDKRWTPGKFMLTISERELKRDAQAILQRKLNEFVKVVLNDK